MEICEDRRRSIFWNFFDKCTDDIVRCKICSKTLKGKMTRHFRLKHRALYSKILPLIKTRDSDGGTNKKENSLWVKKYSTEIDPNKFKCNLCESVMKISEGHENMGRMMNHIRTRHLEVYESEVNAEGNLEQKGADDTDAEADVEHLKEYILEEQTVATSDSSKVAEPKLETSGSRVPEAIIYQDVNDVEPAWDPNQFDDIEYISDTEPEAEEKIKWLARKRIPGKKSTLSCIWNFYKPTEHDHTYNCLFCRKNISIFRNSCTNLRRHLKLKHYRQYKIITQYEPERKIRSLNKPLDYSISDGDFTKSFETSYFEKLEDGSYKCRSCDDVIDAQESDRLVLFKHIHVKHGEEVISGLDHNVDEDDEFSVLLVKKKDLELL